MQHKFTRNNPRTESGCEKSSSFLCLITIIAVFIRRGTLKHSKSSITSVKNLVFLSFFEKGKSSFISRLLNTAMDSINRNPANINPNMPHSVVTSNTINAKPICPGELDNHIFFLSK
jgi:hypothetical protein